MKVVILAGGLGTRISEESHLKPKPMIEIGNRPLLWHIMKIYSQHGINEFVICCGYKGYVIKEYFSNYYLHTSDVTLDIRNNRLEVHHEKAEPWKVTLIDTGDETPTGTRLKKVRKYISEDDEFCLTYGDGLSSIDITSEIDFHRSHGKLATLVAAKSPGKYGILECQNQKVVSFREKIEGEGNRINGGFFVFSSEVFSHINGSSVSLEIDTLPKLASMGELMSFNHDGFWYCMDTLRDKLTLENLWSSGNPPWIPKQ